MNAIEAHNEQIRRRLLTIARLNGKQFGDSYVPASMFNAAKDDLGVGDSEERIVDLVGDLLGWGLLEEAVYAEPGRRDWRHRRFRLTTKGWRLWNQQIEPVPGVADDRLG